MWTAVLLLHLTNAEEVQCPAECHCKSRRVNCSKRGLLSVPLHIPRNTHKLDLQGNNISIIRNSDFRNMRHLHSLNLAHNQIHIIEDAAFSDLIRLTRLRLSHNYVKHLPTPLMSPATPLIKLDLSQQFIQTGCQHIRWFNQTAGTKLGMERYSLYKPSGYSGLQPT